MSKEMKRFAFIGSGLYCAAFIANLRAQDFAFRAHVIEKRSHIGGNCYTKYNEEAGCHEHVYGPHIFHTNSEMIWSFVNQYAEFNHFRNCPKSFDGIQFHSLPFNLDTIRSVFGSPLLSPNEARLVLADDCKPYQHLNDNESVESWCLKNIGPKMYNALVKGYTTKQWGREPKDLPASIIKRLPLRFTLDNNYFNDKYQGIPKEGYTQMIMNMFDGQKITFNTKMEDLGPLDYWLEHYDHVVYSGPIDALFNYCYGRLEYRSLRFETELLDKKDHQGIAIVNDSRVEVAHTRTIEHKHFDMNLSKDKTLITREFPKKWEEGDIEFYPVNDNKNQELYQRYKEHYENDPLLKEKIVLGGRLGSYRYYDMHQIIGQALADSNELLIKLEPHRDIQL